MALPEIPEGKDLDIATGELVDINPAEPAPEPSLPAVAAAPEATGFQTDPATGKLVQIAPVSYDAAVEARNFNLDQDATPFQLQAANQPLDSATGQTAADTAKTELQIAQESDLPIGEARRTNPLRGTPMGFLELSTRPKATGAGGSAEIEISGKQVPDSPLGKALVQQGAARQIAGQLAQLNARTDALSREDNFLQRLQQDFGEFDGETIQSMQRLQEREDQQLDKVTNLIAEARTRTVNPTAFYGNAGNASAFAAAMATAVGAVTSSLGGMDENAAGRIIEQAVERNIRAQELSIQQQNFADEASINLLSHIRATVATRTQSRSVLRSMLYNQAELEFKRMTAVAQREQIPGQKQMVVGMTEQKAGQALLDFAAESATEFKYKAKGVAAQGQLRQLTQRQAAAAAAPQRGKGTGGGPRSRPAPKSSMETAQEQQQAQAQAQAQTIEVQRISDIKGKTVAETEALQAQAGRAAVEPIVTKIFQDQSVNGSYTIQEAKQLWESNPLLRTFIDSPKYLMADTYGESAETMGAFRRKVFLGPIAQGLSEKDKLKLLKNMGFAYRAQDVSHRLFQFASEIGPELIKGVLTADGKIPAANSAQYQRANEIRAQLMQQINIMRSMFEGGALHGPGEFKIFEEMAAQMKTTDIFVAMLARGGSEAFIAGLDVAMNTAQELLEVYIGSQDVITDESQLADQQGIGQRIKGNLAP